MKAEDLARQGVASAVRVFVDCEFTDFIDCDLISIALVADDGREFYGERSDYDQASCSAFVREAVLPQLGQYPGRVFTREALRTALLAWLDQFAGKTWRTLCFDYAGDWELLVDLVGELPPGWQACHFGEVMDFERLETYFREHGGRHHALHDARAHRYACV
ncbi:3'-5' exoribonuclease [Ralstonia pseudosolanacearum]|uniref:3'-5' exoribonuclease n=1 Tax=Ralstonia pseudosolanacearum TaxID=1310165 RepID=UPI001FF94551|nr:3'-5' exoribonuclease [Ralstonia pseudosolanacearum]